MDWRLFSEHFFQLFRSADSVRNSGHILLINEMTFDIHNIHKTYLYETVLYKYIFLLWCLMFVS